KRRDGHSTNHRIVNTKLRECPIPKAKVSLIMCCGGMTGNLSDWSKPNEQGVTLVLANSKRSYTRTAWGGDSVSVPPSSTRTDTIIGCGTTRTIHLVQCRVSTRRWNSTYLFNAERLGRCWRTLL